MALSNREVEAAERGDTAAIEAWFAQAGSRSDGAKRRLLDVATASGQCETMRLLLERGASPCDARGVFGDTPLHAAAFRGHRAAAALLLDFGARVDARTAGDYYDGGADGDGDGADGADGEDCGLVPLFCAAVFGHADMIRLLLRRGADVDARVAGRTAEAWARREGCAAAAALLADVKAAGGWAPFERAYVREPRVRVLRLRSLCERGRARARGGLLRRLFPWPGMDGADEGGATPLPREVFWLVLSYWRCDRDDSDDPGRA